MQKIFIVMQDATAKPEEIGNFAKVNEFIREGGKIISVTAQNIAAAGQGSSPQRGRWLVVAEDGGIKL
jgi:hypothetical protein